MKTIVVFLFVIFGLSVFPTMAQQLEKTPPLLPDTVKAVIDNKCFGCHNSDSKNDKAKEDLNFSTFNQLSKIQQISAYKRIHDTVEADEMPPQKFLKRYPHKTLSESEKLLLTQWAKKEAEALVKGL